VSNPYVATAWKASCAGNFSTSEFNIPLEETREGMKRLSARENLVEEYSPLSDPIFRLNVAERNEIERLLEKTRKRRNLSSGGRLSKLESEDDASCR